MGTTKTAFRVHRWLSYAIGLQVVLWVLGGLVFAWLPFQAWVKGADVLRRPALVLPACWPAHVAATLAALPAGETTGETTGLLAVATPAGPAIKLSGPEPAVPRLVPADGSAWVAPDADAVRRFAASMYVGDGRIVDVARLAGDVPRRLGLVDETGGRADLWRVRFDDRLSTRLYFDGRSGEFVALRNEAWVWYDFFWRLHIMDYGGGEDFNHPLLRGAALAAGALVAAGLLLSALAARRTLRRRRLP